MFQEPLVSQPPMLVTPLQVTSQDVVYPQGNITPSDVSCPLDLSPSLLMSPFSDRSPPLWLLSDPTDVSPCSHILRTHEYHLVFTNHPYHKCHPHWCVPTPDMLPLIWHVTLVWLPPPLTCHPTDATPPINGHHPTTVHSDGVSEVPWPFGQISSFQSSITFSELCNTTASGLGGVTGPTVSIVTFSCAKNISIHTNVELSLFTMPHQEISTEVVHSISTRGNCEDSSAGIIAERTNAHFAVKTNGWLSCFPNANQLFIGWLEIHKGLE